MCLRPVQDKIDVGNETVITQDDCDGEEGPTDVSEVLSPIELPCGRIVPNRLVKAAMYEHLAPMLGGPPNPTLDALYAIWARGGWGMVITGNVQVSRSHLSLGADMVVPDCLSEESVKSFRRLASAIKGENLGGEPNGNEARPLAIMQLNHTGRQSPNGLGGRWPFIQPPLSASATRVGTSSESRRADNLLTRAANAVLFQTARAMTENDVKKTVDSFARGARVAVQSGFDGVQIHGAHGYLISQFISRKTNLRIDAYASPLALLQEIVQAIRCNVPRDFIVGLKLNTADYSTGGFSETEGVMHLGEIARWEWGGAGIDFIEISGGDYESPEFMQEASPRQAFFESFSHIALKAVEQDFQGIRPPLIMLTGGLRTRVQFSRVLRSRHAHLLGLARLSVLNPDLPRLLREHHENMKTKTYLDKKYSVGLKEVTFSWEMEPSPEPRSPTWWPRLVGAGVGMAWYVVALHRLAMSRRLPYNENWVLIVLEMYLGGFGDRSARCIVFITITAIATTALHFIR